MTQQPPPDPPRDPPPDPDDDTIAEPVWPEDADTRVQPRRGTLVEEREEVEAPRRLPTLWPWLLAFLVLVLGGLGAAFYFSGDDDEEAAPTTQTVERVAVPVLVGLREARALEVVREAGLESEIRRRSGNRPAGVVVAQEPESGGRIAEGASVLLTVSRGPARETVPDLVGEQLNQALDDLRDAGFESDVQQVFAAAASGVVTRQDPAPGGKLKEGSVVALTVSKGPKPVPVPEVVGQQASEASATLRDAGFEVNLVPVPSQEPDGTVVAQNPTAGTVPEPGTPVRLNVAQGGTSGSSTGATTTEQTSTTPAPPTRATVPDVVGLTQAQATKAFADVGLKSSLQFVPSQDQPAGAVVAQARAAGTTLASGESVQINISVGPDQVPLVAVPDVISLDEAEARSQLESAGFRVQVLRESTDDASQDGIVVDQEPQRAPEGGLVTIYVGRA